MKKLKVLLGISIVFGTAYYLYKNRKQNTDDVFYITR